MNYRLFLFEIVFACLIILCHMHFPSGEIYIDSLGRSGVLFFFIVSAFFYNSLLNKEDYSYRFSFFKALRLVIIGVVTLLVYYIILIPVNISTIGTPKLFSEFTFENIVDFVNLYFPSTGFIWFIFSLAICYLLFPLVNKIRWFHENKFSVLVPIAILLVIYAYRIVASKYDLGFFSRYEVTRNFLFTGIPCFLIGTYIYDRFEKLKEVRSVVFFPVIIALFGICVLEAHIHNLISGKPNEFYIASIAIAILTSIYALQHQKCKVGEFMFKLFGKTAYMFIYLLHVLFLYFFTGLLSFDFTGLLLIFIVIVSCLMISLIYNLFKKIKQ